MVTLPNSLSSRLMRAALGSVGVQAVGRGLTVVLSVATARTLSPEEIGVLGLAVIIVSVLSAIGACIETAAITLQDASDRQSALAAVVLRAIVTSAAVLLTAVALPPGTRLLTETASQARTLELLVQVLLTQLVLETLGTFPRVVVQRRLDLHFLNATTLAQIVTHVGLSLAVLASGGGTVGLAVVSLASFVVTAALLWWRIVRRWPEPDRAAADQLWSRAVAGSLKVSTGVLAYLNGRIDNALVSGILGPAAMSFYAMAWTAARLPVNLLGHTFDVVLLPTLSRICSDSPRVGRALETALRHYYLALAPAVAVIIVSSGSLVVSVLGPTWLPTAAVLYVMGITILADPVIATSRVLLMALGKAHLVGVGTAVHLLALLVAVPSFTVRWGIVGAAVGDLAAVLAVAAVLFSLSRHAVPDVRYAIVRSAVRPVVTATVAGGVAAFVGHRFDLGPVRLFWEVAVVLAVYLTGLAVLGDRAALAQVGSFVRNAPSRTDASTGMP